jgi:hypothetical protein
MLALFNDNIEEEQFARFRVDATPVLKVNGAASQTFGTVSSVVWIEDNDANFVITGGSVTERGVGSLSISRMYPNTHELTVPFGNHTDSAAAGSDVTAPTSVLIPAGQTTVSILVSTLGA